MKFVKIISSLLLATAALTVFYGCDDDDESRMSKAVLASTSSLTFDVSGTEAQTITIYADADWIVEDCPDWMAVIPSSGNCETYVTVTVADNYAADGEPDSPRSATLVFKGNTAASEASVLVSQEGDKYRDLADYTIGDVINLVDGTVISIPEALVAAVGSAGFIATDMDGSATIYVTSTESVSVGDKVSIVGDKASNTYSLPIVAGDGVEVISSGMTVPYPEPTDITDLLDTYNSSSWNYVTMTGVLNGTILSVIDGEGSFSLNIVDGYDSDFASSMVGHILTVTGYYAGTASPYIRFFMNEYEDGGAYEVIYFSDDFEWLAPWVEDSNAGDTVGSSTWGGETAPNIDTYSFSASLGDILEEFADRGYGYVCTPGVARYLQANYLKFGKTNYQGGITLPPLEIPEGTDFVISFDWAPMVGSTGKFDNIGVLVLIGDDEVAEFSHSFVDTQSTLSWLNASVTISGASYTITEDTVITIRSNHWGEASTTYSRWFLDNIKVYKAD